MSFVTATRDYVELINNLYDSTSGNVTLFTFCSKTFLYFLETVGNVCSYFITFQWLRDVPCLPIIVPQFSTSIINEVFWLDDFFPNLFNLSTYSQYPPAYADNRFLIGFLNSFLFCLPISCSHLIICRRLFVQGTYAGLASGLGTLFGFLTIITSVVLGFRPFIIPWFSFEPVPYILGLGLVFFFVFRIIHYSNRKIVQSFEKGILLRIFLFNFTLAWCEQVSICHYLEDFSFGPEPTLFDLDQTDGHLFYLVGLLIGGLFFLGVVGFLLKRIEDLFVTHLFQRISSFKATIDGTVQITLLILAFTSFPFYGFDFLLAGPLGFVSQDKGLEKSPFSPYGQRLIHTHNKKPILEAETDVIPFGRGDYLQPDSDLPEFASKSFEDLNYGAEFAWNLKGGDYARKKSALQKPLGRFFTQIVQNASDFSNKQTYTTTPLGAKTSKNDHKERVKTKVLFGDVDGYKANDLTYKEKIIASSLIQSNSHEILEKEESEPTLSPQNLRENRPSFYNRADGTNDPIKDSVDRDLSPLFDNTFSNDLEEENMPQTYLDKKAQFAGLYYSNPIYKFLLASDIDIFVNRQPASRMLSSRQEKELFQKRSILAAYYDTLREYKKLPYYAQFQDRFTGSKSYAERVYNQQFKGTLRVVRRLFAVTLDPDSQSELEKEQNFSNSQSEYPSIDGVDKDKLVVKFDQPLFRDRQLKGTSTQQDETPLDGRGFDGHPRPSRGWPSNPFILLHEELGEPDENTLSFQDRNEESNSLILENDLDENLFDGNVSAENFSENLNKFLAENNLVLDDAEENEMFSSFENSDQFLEIANPRPFYAGWDEQLRKLIVTNRLRPRVLTGYTLTNPNNPARLTGESPKIDQMEIDFLGLKYQNLGDIHEFNKKGEPLNQRLKDNLYSSNQRLKNKDSAKQNFDSKNEKNSIPKVSSQKIPSTYSYIGFEKDLFSPTEANSISFTAWPIPEEKLKSYENVTKIPHALLFASIDDPGLKPEIKPFFVPTQEFLTEGFDLHLEKKMDLTKLEKEPEKYLTTPLNYSGLLKSNKTKYQITFIEPALQGEESEESKGEAKKDQEGGERGSKKGEEKDVFYFDPEKFNMYLYKKIPNNIVKQLGVSKVSPPLRGGFVWPGQYSFKLDLKQFWRQ